MMINGGFPLLVDEQASGCYSACTMLTDVKLTIEDSWQSIGQESVYGRSLQPFSSNNM